MSIRRAEHWTQLLRRRTTSGTWLPEIDGLRFVAIASVLMFHIQGQFEHHYKLEALFPFALLIHIFDLGYRGVPLFFAVSGFILALPFARHHLFEARRPSLRHYLLRRITRLEPPYLLNLFLVATGAALVNHQTPRSLLPHLAASAAYLHYAVFREPSTINSVAWSLEVEVQFYLLAPLLCLVFCVSRHTTRRALLACLIAIAGMVQISLGLSQFTLAGNLQYFFAGLLVADLYLVSMPKWRNSYSFDLLGGLSLGAFFLLDKRGSALWLPWIIAAIFAATLRGKAIGTALRTPVIAITGGMCYTIYLWHAPVLTLVDRAARHFAFLTPSNYGLLLARQLPIKLAAVALICLPLFLWVERPCMDPGWPRRVTEWLRNAVTPLREMASARER
ncbi:MAG TPA: acyltransferase [Acidobacteriaceae bacterium]|nr:acyltransferase [Acidobacteriaceae bacterium]